MKRTKMPAFFQLPSQSNLSLKEQKSSVHSLLIVLSKVTVLINENVVHATVQMGVLKLKVLILINGISQCHILTHSESTLLSQLFIDSLPGF